MNNELIRKYTSTNWKDLADVLLITNNSKLSSKIKSLNLASINSKINSINDDSKKPIVTYLTKNYNINYVNAKQLLKLNND